MKQILFSLFLIATTAHAQQQGSSLSPFNPGITPYINSISAYNRDKNTVLSSPYVKNLMIMFRWSDLEPAPGDFKFDETIGRILRDTKGVGKGFSFMIWVGPNSPEWIYDNGVPLVTVTGGNESLKYPYYFSPKYREFFFRLVTELGNYIKSLPQDEVDNILYFQVSEGTTGDTSPYQGASVPVDPQYKILPADWMDFRMEVWDKYKEALWRDGQTVIPFLFTDDANTDRERNWQLQNLNRFGAKKGQFGHGYNNNNIFRLIAPWLNLQKDARDNNILIFARGEWDNILLAQGWVQKNPPLAFYWSAIAALFFDINYWNPLVEIIDNSELYADGLSFYNSHVGSLGNPSKASYAFCAMHRMLEVLDVNEFPEATYGQAVRTNIQRYRNIIADFAARGAMIGDESTLPANSIASRRRMDYNDIGWSIYEGNFYKYLEQIEPETTSDAYWNLDQTIYGRFARGFRQGSDNKMYFKLDSGFFNSADPQKVSITITSKDTGTGSWELLYFDGAEMVSAGTVTNSGTDKWVKNVFAISCAVFNGSLEKGADLIIRQVGSENTFFHLVDLKREE